MKASMSFVNSVGSSDLVVTFKRNLGKKGIRYSTPREKTDKMEELVNRELDVTRSGNFIHIVNLA